MEREQKLAFMENLIQQPMDKSRKKCQKCLAGREEFEGNEETTVLEFMESYQAKKMEYGFAGSVQVRHGRLRQPTYFFKTTQLLFEVVHDVEGGRARARVLRLLGKMDKALGRKPRPAHSGSCKRKKKSADGRSLRLTKKVMWTDLFVSSFTKK